jgi:hypothetical protein
VVPFFVFFLLFNADLTSSGAIFLLSLCHSYVTPKTTMSRYVTNFEESLLLKGLQQLEKTIDFR